MSHLHDLAKALRTSADANDMAQVKRYIGQINEFADNLDNQEKAKKAAEDQANKDADQPSRKGAGGTGASQPDSEKHQKVPETTSAETEARSPRR